MVTVSGSPASPSPPLVLLAGPTATGKTALAVALARRLGGEIVSADSMQVYRGFAVGTAQPTTEELGGVPCHLIACAEPDRPWSAADWLRQARDHIADIQARGRAAIVAGGTGLYFKALTGGLFEGPGAGRCEGLRRRLETEWDADDGETLRRRLEEADPAAAARIHRRDRVRTVRALEVWEVAGEPMSQLQERSRRAHRPPAAWRFVLTASRELLYSRIDRRVLDMMARGFLEEVASLVAGGASEDWPAMRAVGYPQMLRHLRGQATGEEAIEETQRLSRRYAKQQIVLLRRWPGAVWLDARLGVERLARAVEIVLEFQAPEWFI